MVEFHTRERVMNHIKFRSHVCRENLLMRPPILTHEQADELDAAQYSEIRKLAARGQRRSHASVPCVRLQGPLISVVIDPKYESAHHALGRGRNQC